MREYRLKKNEQKLKDILRPFVGQLSPFVEQHQRSIIHVSAASEREESKVSRKKYFEEI